MIALALKDLMSRPGRSALTAVGVAMGLAAYMMVFAAGSLYLSQARVLSSLLGTSLLVQQGGAPSPFSSFLDPTLSARLVALPHVLAAHPATVARVRALGAASLIVVGFESEGALAGRVPLASGRFPRPGAQEIILGQAAAARLRMSAGHVLTLRGMAFTVVGVYRTELGMLDAGGLTDVTGAQALGNVRNAVSLFLLEVERGRERDVVRAIGEHIVEVEALDVGEYLGTIGVLRIADAFVSLLGVVVVLFVTLVVANTLGASVYERRQELAVLRALGWSGGLVARLILTEVSLLATAGCLMGWMGAHGTLWLLRLVGPETLRTSGILPGYIPPSTVLAGVGVGFAACLIGAAVPLVRAVRIRPWEGLRSP